MGLEQVATGWYFKRHDDATDAKGGPYTWEQMTSFAAQGVLAPIDLVWHQTFPGWVPAHDVAGLFVPGAPHALTPQPLSAMQPAAGAAPAASAARPVPMQQPAPPRKSRTGIVVGLALAGVVLLGAVVGGGWWFLSRSGGGLGGDAAGIGVAKTTVPDRKKLVQTAEWGEVPANRICVMLAEDGRRKDAEKVAGELGGTVVGEVEFVNLYQIEFPGATESDLTAALRKAAAAEKVDLAFPNQQVYPDAEIWGVRVDPYEDPFYGGGAGDGYRAIGVSKAWNYIRGSGVDLNSVKVGVVDDGLYLPGEGVENEFEGGKVKIEFPDPAAGENAGPEVWENGEVNPAGSHGTGVSTIIGANPDNGGPAGVAGPLGDKLTISMINHYSGQYGDTESTPDPADPTKYVWTNGKTYVDGSLVALTKQVAGGAKVINCSWGNSEASTVTVAAYRRFFEKMAAEHPDVVFVCSGGNGGQVMNGANRIPSGLKLPNMITVGALDNDGQTASYADKASDDYEITLGAPGTGQVVGIKPKGGPEKQNGSSFAAPQVTAAAAILKALDPKLQAADIKRILTETARTGVPNNSGDPNASSKLIGPEMGGRIVALDEAVLKVINDLRVAKGLKAFTPEDLENLGVVDAVAITGEPGEYTVKGIVKSVGEDGTRLTIQITGENYALGGRPTQELAGAGEAKWDVTLPKDEGTVKVTRDENGAASIITIERFDINGKWSGSFTITEVEITDQKAAEQEGCGAALLGALKGKQLPMTMDITVDEGGDGTGIGFIDVSAADPEGNATSKPQQYGVSYSGATIKYEPQEAKGVKSMTATVSRKGENLVQNGVLTGGGKGWRVKAVFTLSKPYTPK